MSVIMGYKTEDKIYLGADNRVSTPDDIFIRDDANKIFVINDNVAVAFAGYRGTQMVLEKMMQNSKKDFMVEDAFICIKRLYWICKFLWYKKSAKNILNIGSRFIVAGKNRKGEYCIYVAPYLHGKFEKPSLIDRFIFPPADVSEKVCCDIYAINTIHYQHNFMKKTVKEIAKVSKLVSYSGDIWIYDLKTGTSTMEHFT